MLPRTQHVETTKQTPSWAAAVLAVSARWPQPRAARRARCPEHWADPGWMAVPGGPRGTRQSPQAQKTPKDPASPVGFPHQESIFKGVSQKWSGLSGAVIHPSHPGRQAASWPNPLLPPSLLHIGLPSKLRRGSGKDTMLVPVNIPALHGSGCQHPTRPPRIPACRS